MSAALRRYGGNLLAALAMVSTLIGVAVGLPAADRALPDTQPIAADRPYGVGAGLSLLPPAGASLDVTRTRPGPRRGTAVFLLDGVTYGVTVQPYAGTQADALARFRNRLKESGAQQAGAERSVTTANGLTGREGRWTAPGRAGRYAVFLVPGRSIEVLVSGTEADLVRTAAATGASMRSIRYEAPR